MKRRQLLRSLSAAGALSMVPGLSLTAHGTGNGDRCVVTVHADGGWDVTAFCDPKINVVGEKEISRWSRSGEVQTAGNLNYASFGNNQSFFDKYYQDMMVVNGIDAQTNAHSTGIIHNWSGRTNQGLPSLNSLYSSLLAPSLPMSYLNFGGFGQTQDLIAQVKLKNISLLEQVVRPNLYPEGVHIRDPEAMAIVREAQLDRLRQQLDNDRLLYRQRLNLRSQLTAFENLDALENLADILPDQTRLQPEDYVYDGPQTLRQQIQMSLLAFKAGVTSAADLQARNFDSHTQNDAIQESVLSYLLDSLDYLWTYAEELGIADRLLVIVGSDFGRTPFYNSYDGKDHWPIGSYIFMEKNAAWANRVVGLTDEGHNAYKINPTTLQRDDINGSVIYPKHVHKALRRYLGIEGSDLDLSYPLNAAESFDLFSPDLQTSV